MVVRICIHKGDSLSSNSDKISAGELDEDLSVGINERMSTYVCNKREPIFGFGSEVSALEVN